MRFKYCARCGGAYQYNDGSISAGMYNPPKVWCRCPNGPASTRQRTQTSPRQQSYSPPVIPQSHRPAPPQNNQPKVTMSVNQAALWQQMQQATSSVVMPPFFYVAATAGVLMMVASVAMAAFSDGNGGWWVLGLAVGFIVSACCYGFYKLIVGDAVNQRMQQLAQSTTASLKTAVVNQQTSSTVSGVVPLSQRPQAPCRNCGKNVIAGSTRCHHCGHTGFQWECTSCGGPFVMTDIGLLYCNRCQGYWQ